MSSISVRRIQTTISVLFFLYFNLNKNAIKLNNVGHDHINFLQKNLHIESFNFSIKSICFDFCSTNMGSSVIKTGRSEGTLLSNFYPFTCHYPLRTYLSVIHTYDLSVKDSLLNQIMRSTMEKFEKKLKYPHESFKRIRQVGASPLSFQEEKSNGFLHMLKIIQFDISKLDIPLKIIIISNYVFGHSIFKEEF